MIGIPTIARAHPLEPSLVTIVKQPNHLAVEVRTLPTRRLNLQSPCAVTLVDARRDGEHHVETQRWLCPADPAGAHVTLVAEPGEPPVVLRIDGDAQVLDATHPSAALTRPSATLSGWIVLGMEHLATGLDHVLLVLGLLALIGLRARLVAALTAFTLGHSLSLALAATGTITLPSTLVEVAIALTLVGLGLELSNALPRSAGASHASVVERAPWAIGAGIGLIHGLGFAGALADLHLEPLGVALVGFNLGLELAQLALVVAAAAFSYLLAARWRPPLVAALGWLIGIAGATWTLDRMLG